MNKQSFQIWLSEQLGMDITHETMFFDDLALGEDDIEIFINKFSSVYQIDMTLFNYTKYSSKLLRFPKYLLRNQRPLTFNIDHLFQVVLKKKWFDPDM
jgi:hypothetical protein